MQIEQEVTNLESGFRERRDRSQSILGVVVERAEKRSHLSLTDQVIEEDRVRKKQKVDE